MSSKGLFKERKVYKPLDYQWAYDAWYTQQKIHWLPEEVPMNDDIRDWKYNLTTAEQNLLTQIFRFFTQADIEVNNCYMKHYARLFKPIEIQMMLTAFSNMETVHVVGYAYLLDTLGLPEVEYQAFLKYKAMSDKADYLSKVNPDSLESIALTLATFGAFTEGLQLFASFAILLNFPRFNKMKGMGQIVTWSIRDETLHTLSIIKLFNTLKAENPEIWTESMQDKIYDICYKMVQLEDAFIDLAFEMGDIKGLTADDVKLYIRYTADKRLIQLGLKKVYRVKSNPLTWLDEILNGVEHTNFFENRVTEYTKSSTKGTWENVFDTMDKSPEQREIIL